MLKELHVNNFALIKELHFLPKKGLNVITGETGAGKSIMFDALGLALGKRAEGVSFYEDTNKCIIEAHFMVSKDLEKTFESRGLDYEELSIFRREISPSGRSRLFINDTPSSLTDAKEIGNLLIDIHSQHESLDIFKPKNLLRILDTIADNQSLVANFSKKFWKCKKVESKIIDLKSKFLESEKQRDYNEFLYTELEQMNLSSRDNQLENELNKLTNAEEIKFLSSSLVNALGGEELSALSILDQVQTEVIKLSALINQSSLSERFKSILLELKDMIAEMENVAVETDLNGERLEDVQERFNALQNLYSKHGVNNIEELIKVKEKLSKSLEGNSIMAEDIAELELALKTNNEELNVLAKELSLRRSKAVKTIEPQVLNNLLDLELNHAQLKFVIDKGNLTESGWDQISLYFSANKNMEPKLVLQSASGGELSRLALVMKSLASDSIPTLIFDEIDTGVSGKVSQKIGALLKGLGVDKQIISITHSPQVSSAADCHYFVSKVEMEDKMHTLIKELSTKERVEAIAQMLSGDEITEEALKNAESLLLIAQK